MDYKFYEAAVAATRVGFASAVVTACLLLLTACSGKGGGAQDGENAADTGRVDTVPTVVTERDSTVYGRADGFGQGGFTLLTDDGQLLELTLTTDDVNYAAVWGDRADTARYAVTLSADGAAALRVINLSQLSRMAGLHYLVRNAELYVLDDEMHPEAVTIDCLTDKVLQVHNAAGDIRQWRSR